VFINTEMQILVTLQIKLWIALSAKVQTPVTLQMQLCIATSAKPQTAPTAALTFTNTISDVELSGSDLPETQSMQSSGM
jgi:hypothetical protein